MFWKTVFLWKLIFKWRGAHIIVIVVLHIPSPVEIRRSFVLMRSSILRKVSLQPHVGTNIEDVRIETVRLSRLYRQKKTRKVFYCGQR